MREERSRNQKVQPPLVTSSATDEVLAQAASLSPDAFAISEFHEGLARVKIGSKWGYIDKSGRFVIQPQFDTPAGDFSDGLAQVKINNKNGYIGNPLNGLK